MTFTSLASSSHGNCYVVNDGERICQMVIKQYSHVEWEEVSELDRTKRENGAFGHTGVN